MRLKPNRPLLVVPPAHKYALLGLSTVRLSPDFPSELKIADDARVFRSLPINLPDHWKAWLGTTRTERLSTMDAYVAVVGPSKSPAILDHENQGLVDYAHRIYLGLVITVMNMSHGQGMMLTGANRENGTDVREVQEYSPLHHISFGADPDITDADLRPALSIASSLSALRRGRHHDRLWRMLRAFFAAAESRDIGTRLHQFVRCVEGVIFPRVGRAKADFAERGVLLIGADPTRRLPELYDIRSAVEHLHGALRTLPALEERRRAILLLERTLEAELLARHCLQRLFLQSQLWPYFEDHVALEQFWRLDGPTQRALWGSPLDLDVATKDFRSDWLSDEDLGISRGEDRDLETDA